MQCPICLDPNDAESQDTPCHHRFHAKCMRDWEKEGTNKCPVCRLPIDPFKPVALLKADTSEDALLARRVREMEIINALRQMFGAVEDDDSESDDDEFNEDTRQCAVCLRVSNEAPTFAECAACKILTCHGRCNEQHAGTHRKRAVVDLTAEEPADAKRPKS